MSKGVISRAKKARLRGRTSAEFKVFYDSYYKESGLDFQIVFELLQEISEAVELPMGMIKPHDRFLQELSDVKGLETADGGLAELTFAARRRQQRLGCSFDLSKVQTVDDYIKAFGSFMNSPKSG